MNKFSEFPVVSVITPSFNQGDFIEATIQNVLAQRYPNIQHIIIDGGSTDNTLEILKKYDTKISWISEPDQGQSDAINKGLKLARGEIVAWLCADDLYEEGAISTAVEWLRDHPDISMVYGACIYIDSKGQVIGAYPSKTFDLATLVSFNFIPQPTVFIVRSVLDRVGPLDARLQFTMDLDLWLRIGMQYRISYIPKVLSRYRLYPGSKTVTRPIEVEREGIQLRAKYLADPQLKLQLGSLFGNVCNTVYLKAASFFFYQGDTLKTFKFLFRGLMACPLSSANWKLPFAAWRAFKGRKYRRSTWNEPDARINRLVGAHNTGCEEVEKSR